MRTTQKLGWDWAGYSRSAFGSGSANSSHSIQLTRPPIPQMIFTRQSLCKACIAGHKLRHIWRLRQSATAMFEGLCLKVEPSRFSATQLTDTGDLEAQYRRHWAAIRRYVVQRFGSGPPDPDDVVQAAFERFARLDDRATILDPVAFLRRSAHNFVLDHHRAEKVRARHAGLEEPLKTYTDELDPERVLLARQRFAIIERTIRGMDEKRRDVLIMSRVQGLSSAEIARQLGCSPTLVKMRLAEAVTLCQRALRAEGLDL